MIPVPDRGTASGGGDTVSTVTGAFAQALEIPALGAEDSFFDLGGDSLIAVDIIAALSDIFGLTLSMTAIYNAPTPAALATLIDAELVNVQLIDAELAGAEAVAA